MQGPNSREDAVDQFHDLVNGYFWVRCVRGEVKTLVASRNIQWHVLCQDPAGATSSGLFELARDRFGTFADHFTPCCPSATTSKAVQASAADGLSTMMWPLSYGSVIERLVLSLLFFDPDLQGLMANTAASKLFLVLQLDQAS